MSNEQFQRISDLFVQARKLGLHEREVFLDTACGEDDGLRNDVEELLVAANDPLPYEGLAENLRGAHDAMAAQPLPTVASNNHAEDRNSHIGAYKLLEMIGEGGFGVVYAAEQEKPVRRRVALKIIKVGMDTRQVVARFEAERQALAMMDHPNIARVLDAGATETGRPYFVMELVRGVPITEYCDRNKLSMRDRLELFRSVCGAVQHAHQKGRPRQGAARTTRHG